MEDNIYTIDNVFYNTLKLYPQLRILNENFEKILNEIQSNLSKEFIDTWCSVFDNKIHMIPIYFFGIWTQNVYTRFPFLSKLLSEIPDILTVELSILEPNCQITPHVGGNEISGRLMRCHIGIEIPEKCGFICENYIQMHKTNEWITFDNARTHNVFNLSDKRRLVIIIDMIRPTFIEPVESGRCYLQELLSILPNFHTQEQIEKIKENIFLDDWHKIECKNPFET